MDKVKIVDWRGIRDVVAAKVLKDDADGITYDTPFSLCGTSSLSKSTETSTGTKYYDNVPAIGIRSVGADEVAIEASAIPEDVVAKIMGEYYDEETGMHVEGEPSEDYWALGYITKKTDGTEMYVWRLKGIFAYPEEEHNTEDDGTDSTGSSLTYTGINTQHKFTKTGKTAKAVNLPAAKWSGTEEDFFSTVQTPDTIGEA